MLGDDVLEFLLRLSQDLLYVICWMIILGGAARAAKWLAGIRELYIWCVRKIGGNQLKGMLFLLDDVVDLSWWIDGLCGNIDAPMLVLFLGIVTVGLGMALLF